MIHAFGDTYAMMWLTESDTRNCRQTSFSLGCLGRPALAILADAVLFTLYASRGTIGIWPHDFFKLFAALAARITHQEAASATVVTTLEKPEIFVTHHARLEVDVSDPLGADARGTVDRSVGRRG